MFTERGKLHVRRYIGGMVPSIGKSIAFGIGDAVATTNDYKLGFEVQRSNITLTSMDFVTNELIFKAPVPDEFGGIITEVGVYSLPTDILAGSYGSKTLATFDSGREFWVDISNGLQAAVSTSGVRLGTKGVSHAPTASQTKTAALTQIFLDLSGYSNADKFVLALNSANSNASNVKVQFLTDSSNYYELTFSGISAGYNIKEVAKSAAAVTGNPNWSNISEIRVRTTATSGGTANVTLDGLRVDDADTINPDYILVARNVLASQFVKVPGKVTEHEFRIGVNV